MYDSHVRAYQYNNFKKSGGYGMIGGILSAISDSILGGINLSQQKKWNKQQQENWNKQFEYTKWLNQVQMEREDSAVQRRAADLEKAGMNRLMAAGDGAEAGTLTSFQGNAGGNAPQFEGNPIESYLAARQSQANIANTEAQTQLIKNKADSEKASQNLKGSQKAYYDVLTANSKYEGIKNLFSALREQNDYIIESGSGIKSNDSSRINNLYNTVEMGIKLFCQKFGIDLYGKGMDKETTNDFVAGAVENGQLTWKDWAKAFEKFKNGVDINNLKDFAKLLMQGPKK